MNPLFSQFCEDANKFNTIPIVESMFVDQLTPLQIFHLFKEQAVYFLESFDEESPWSRFSFIGISPQYYVEECHGLFVAKDKADNMIEKNSSLSDLMQQLTNRLKVKVADIDAPFKGGAVGTIGYDAVHMFEKMVSHPEKKADSSVELVICEFVIAIDQRRQKVHFIKYVEVKGDLKEKYDHSIQQLTKLKAKLLTNTQVLSPIQFENKVNNEDLFTNVSSNYSKSKFVEDVEQIKEYIRAGDIFQAVLSQRFELEVKFTAFTLYRVLRMINPSPYLFYYKGKTEELIGSSPERLINVIGDELEIHPIAGTRRRGETAKEDQVIANQLKEDSKELAEHHMLVDLARNDLGRVSQYGTVQTPIQKEIVYFSHVMHMISKVTGKRREDIHPVDALTEAFPAGTVSGAPKIRAMQILNELEPTARQSYAGAMAYIGYDGNIDSCITIRTIRLKENKAYIQAGAGIVADSIPENEWKETRNKASALIFAIKLAEQCDLLCEVSVQ
ncbi:chorismate-binding protein [Bacillus carboniphilus]|uniref:Anthranilate synthase component 1 n=1 Tax=Bacillus carboniphilus TaxID=86663 RepID=A0ABY9JWH0_9BACI|nr:chorismate-binding protein [Bacillus carboniphilus]WLR43736.1 chorismate-binding protein [Bacillus carboniphilus]